MFNLEFLTDSIGMGPKYFAL